MTRPLEKIKKWLDDNEDQFPIFASKSCSGDNPDPFNGKQPPVIYGGDIRKAVVELEGEYSHVLAVLEYAANQIPQDGRRGVFIKAYVECEPWAIRDFENWRAQQ